MQKNKHTIVALQETHLGDTVNRLNNHKIIRAGIKMVATDSQTRNSAGCLTLLGPDTEIIHVVQLEDRGHIIVTDKAYDMISK